MSMEGGIWTKSVLTLIDVQRLAVRHELAIGSGVVVTPLAQEEIRRLGLTLSRREPAKAAPLSMGVGQDRAYAEVQAALAALGREGFLFQAQDKPQAPLQLAGLLGGRMAKGEWQRAALFTSEPELAAWSANKLPGLKAASVANILQAKRAFASLGANLLVIEMPGRTFFEIRQMLHLLATSGQVDRVELEKTDARG